MRYQHDIHGNVTALLGFYGGVIERYTYDVFGSPTILSANNTQLSASAFGNRFMFQGREYFPELGIYDYRHRMYHPGLGRFLQTDPTGFDAGDMNLFRYTGDDPVDRSDPTGLDSDIYLIREYPDRNAPGQYQVYNGAHKLVYKGSANLNPFYAGTHGVAAGEYKLVAKGKGWGSGVFDEHQPAITGYASGLKPGQPNKSYTHGPALVHKANPYGAGPDSAGCVTVDPIGEAKTKQVMEADGKANGVTRFHIRERERKSGEREVRRAESVQSRATDDPSGLGGSRASSENNDTLSVDRLISNSLMGTGDNTGEGFHRAGPR
jgi:RHS repeat-associated protein